MKKFNLIWIVLALILVAGLSGKAFAGATEPPLVPWCDCMCLPTADIEGLKINGPYMKGTFTISYAYDDSDPANEIFLVHLFLRWGNRVYLAPIEVTVDSTPLCDLDEDDIRNAIQGFSIVCNLKSDLIDLEIIDGTKTPMLKDVTITDRGGCEPGSPGTGDDIIRGEIIIGFVPSGTISSQCPALPGDPPSCIE